MVLILNFTQKKNLLKKNTSKLVWLAELIKRKNII